KDGAAPFDRGAGVLTAAAREGRHAPSFETVRLSTDAFRARSSSGAEMPAEHCGKTELPFDLAQDQHAAIRRQLSTIKRGRSFPDSCTCRAEPPIRRSVRAATRRRDA